MKFFRKLLFPFAAIYGAITFLRNKLFDIGWLTEKVYDLPIICVGNLSTGGTGKTPMTEFLIEFLKKDYNIGVLSRGYKRKTKGFLEVLEGSTVAEVGDEPLQFKKKFPAVTVAVCEERRVGIETLKDAVDLILLDDAFQHRKVKPSFSILLTAFNDLYVDDWILPVGNLRESASGAKRANALIVTKCPTNLDAVEMDSIRQRLGPTENQKVFFTKIVYANKIIGEGGTKELSFLKEKHFELVTGIANPDPLVAFLKNERLHFNHQTFPDHHDFTASEIQSMEGDRIILTTEKDYMRLRPLISRATVYYLPITISFLGKAEDGFKNMISKHLQIQY